LTREADLKHEKRDEEQFAPRGGSHYPLAGSFFVFFSKITKAPALGSFFINQRGKNVMKTPKMEIIDRKGGMDHPHELQRSIDNKRIRSLALGLLMETVAGGTQSEAATRYFAPSRERKDPADTWTAGPWVTQKEAIAEFRDDYTKFMQRREAAQLLSSDRQLALAHSVEAVQEVPVALTPVAAVQ